jgi:hypothetical protein
MKLQEEIPTMEQISNMSPAEQILTFKTMTRLIEEMQVDSLVFPAYLKRDQEGYNAFYKVINRENALRVDIGITPINHDGDIRAIARMYTDKTLKDCSPEEFYEAQKVAQDRINKLLIK